MTPLTSMMKETTKRTGNHCTRAPSNVAHGRIRSARGLEVIKKKTPQEHGASAHAEHPTLRADAKNVKSSAKNCPEFYQNDH